MTRPRASSFRRRCPRPAWGLVVLRLPAAGAASNVVLRNNVVVGSVNANRRHWYRAGQALAKADPAWLTRLITRRVPPEQFQKALQREPDDIKVVVQFAEA